MIFWNWPLSQSSQMRTYLIQQRIRLYRVAYSWCHSDALADDLVQETLLRALKYGKGLRNPEATEAWLFRILANCWHDELKRRRELQDISTVDVYSPDDTEKQHYKGELLQQVYTLMSNLPDAQREVIGLVDIGELGYEQVAQILGVPIGTVMSRLNRARASLCGKLSENSKQPVRELLVFGVENEQ